MDTKTKERIERFISIVERVKNARFTRDTKTITFNLNFEAGQPLKQEVSGFDEEDLVAMLADLRKLMLDRDGVRLPDICDLLIANTSSQDTIGNLRKCKDLYASLMKNPAIKMTLNGNPETGESVIKKWLYGRYFHEEQHAKDLDGLGMAQLMHKTSFVMAITDLTLVSAWVANNAKVVLGVA